LNVHEVNDVRQREAHTAAKNHKLRGSDQIPARMIQARGTTIRFEINKHIISFWNKEELPEEWRESITLTI
jgi:hypothetical protein